LQLFIHCGLHENRAVHLLTIADDAQALAERGLELLRAHGIHAQPHLLEGNHAGEQILLTAAQLDAGLIVMGAYGRPRFREFLFGSVTRELLKRTSVPLFLYH
jgi:nucleotide-binding universal stress UspA family protein